MRVIKWGTQQGKQRFKCQACGILFTNSSITTKRTNQKIWFEHWIIGRQTITQISKASGYSERTLKRLFSFYLTQTPVFTVKPSEKVNLLIDGTYLSNNLCLVLYRDNTIKFTQLYRLTDGEWYEEMKEDLENLLKLGVQIESITCDGHKALLKAIRKACKHVTVQRCIIHVQRMCRIWDVKIYSIGNGGGTVKVFILKLYSGSNQKLYSNKITEIIINCRHDSREQIEDVMKFTYPAKFKVGKYSTDIIIKSDLL